MSAADYCNVVLPLGDKQCLSPPGLFGEVRLRDCFKCGLPVCRSCSKLVAYLGKRTRLCAWCLEEIDRDAKGVPP